jgi:hypothetical protein
MDCHSFCFYCENLLSVRHEHDHFGQAARHGGKATVCACINCHDLKDRNPLSQWDASTALLAFVGLIKKADTMEKIVLSKLVDLWSDATARPNNDCQHLWSIDEIYTTEGQPGMNTRHLMFPFCPKCGKKDE